MELFSSFFSSFLTPAPNPLKPLASLGALAPLESTSVKKEEKDENKDKEQSKEENDENVSPPIQYFPEYTTLSVNYYLSLTHLGDSVNHTRSLVDRLRQQKQQKNKKKVFEGFVVHDDQEYYQFFDFMDRVYSSLPELCIFYEKDTLKDASEVAVFNLENLASIARKLSFTFQRNLALLVDDDQEQKNKKEEKKEMEEFFSEAIQALYDVCAKVARVQTDILQFASFVFDSADAHFYHQNFTNNTNNNTKKKRVYRKFDVPDYIGPVESNEQEYQALVSLLVQWEMSSIKKTLSFSSKSSSFSDEDEKNKKDVNDSELFVDVDWSNVFSNIIYESYPATKHDTTTTAPTGHYSTTASCGGDCDKDQEYLFPDPFSFPSFVNTQTTKKDKSPNGDGDPNGSPNGSSKRNTKNKNKRNTNERVFVSKRVTRSSVKRLRSHYNNHDNKSPTKKQKTSPKIAF